MKKALFDFLKNSPSAYQAVANIRARLDKEGYTMLSEGEITPASGKFYTVRGGTSIIAWRRDGKANGFMISATHSDSPAFRLKMNNETVGAYTRLDVERYGGMIMYSWLDRPLSLAGRVLVRCEGGVEERLVNIDRDLAVIPSVAIHLNRGVNDGYKFNPATDMLPLLCSESVSFREILESEAGGEVISHDLFLYNRDEPRSVGAKDELVLSPRIDDLASVFASLEGFLAASDTSSVPVLAVFDNEEVGSETKQGAASDMLIHTLFSIGGDNYRSMLDGSLMLSADNAHALHPNHPELSDKPNALLLGGGVAVKYNANQRYSTDGLSAALFETLCERARVKTQNYYNRADLPGGSTLGSIANTTVGLPTVDIGVPQLAMHSACECAALSDIVDMKNVMCTLFSSSIVKDGNKYSLT